MASHGPMRLAPDLVDEASREAKRQKRSTRKQIEFWAELGRAVDGVLTHEQAVGLRSGLLVVTAPDAGPVDPDQILADLEAHRSELPNRVTRATVRYQASREHPGFLEQIDSAGRVAVGRFEHGEFTPLDA